MTNTPEKLEMDGEEIATDWFWKTDPSHRFTVLFRPFIYPRDREIAIGFLGRARWEISGSTPISGPWSELTATMDAQRPVRGFQYRHQQDDGTDRLFTIYGEPVFDDHGVFRGYQGISQDLTFLNRIRKERDQAERLFLHAIASVPVAIALFDPEDRLVLWNHHYATNVARAVNLEKGMTLEEILRAALAGGLIPEALGHEEDWLRRRMACHLTPEAPFDLRFGAQSLQVGEHRTSEGHTLLIAHDVTAQQAAEKNLRDQKHLVETIIENIPHAIFWKDRNSVYLGCNQNFLAHRGLTSKDQIVGKRLYEIAMSPEEANISSVNDRLVIETGESRLNTEESLTRDDGSRLVVLSSKVPLRDGEGEIVGTLGIFADITERKRAEAELAASEKRFRDLIEHSIHGIYISRGGKPLFVNQACADIFGYASPRDILALGTVAGLYKPADWKRMRTYAKRRLAGKEAPYRYEVHGIKKDGSPLWLQLNVRLVDWYGAPGFQTTLADITARKRAEMELRESEAFLRAITGSVVDAIVMVDEKGRIAFWNDAAEHMFGYATREAVGRPVHDLLAPRQYREAAECGFRHFVDTGEGPVLGKTVSLHGQRRDGSEFPIDLAVAPLERKEGRHAVAVVRDMTERLNAERHMRQSQRMRALGNLAGGVAHELNNLLLPILTLSQMTMKRMPEDSRDRRKMEMIVEASERARDLVSKVMDFSRQDETEPRELDIHDTVKNALAFLGAALPSTVTIKENLAPGTGIIRGDPAQIQTLIMNLASNAADACEGRAGTLVVSLVPATVDTEEAAGIDDLQTGLYAKLTVEDSGKGMDAETLERAFDPFFTTKDVGEGTGLGLAVVHGIVERHGGAIHVTSQIGEGTRVTVYLPVTHRDN